MLNVKKRIIILFTFIVILIVIIIQIFIGELNKSYYLKATPPENIKTLNSYLEWKPGTKTIYKIENKGIVYYLCLDKPRRIPASGPSAYCFDSNCNFVGWTADIGDLHGSLPQQAYEKRYKWTEINIEEIPNHNK